MNKIVFNAACYSDYVYRSKAGINIYEGQYKILIVDDADTDSVYISFRGSYNPDNWFTNFQIFPVSRGYAGLIHKGFADSVDALFPVINNLLETTYKGRKIVFCGHSLGGAVAQLFGRKFLKLNPLVVTMGSPKVYLRFSTTKKPSHVRIINEDDPVPKLLTFIYGHYQTEIVTISDTDIGWLDPADHISARYLRKLQSMFPEFTKPVFE